MDIDNLLKPNIFADEDGSAPPSLVQALGVSDPALRQEALVSALQTERLLIPLVAQEGVQPEDMRDEDDALTQVFLEIAGGRKAAVAFSSLHKLKEFSSDARPVPLLGRNVAAQSLMHTGLIILDPQDEKGSGGEVLGRSACAAIASADQWLAPWYDVRIHDTFKKKLSVVAACEEVWVKASHDGGVLIAIQMKEDATLGDAQRASVLISDVIRHDEYVKSHLDIVHIVPLRTSLGTQ
ncbi:MAG: SseB family protein [Actinomycetaceae bacterium]|nr:SseB family protein [Actinomycetaceae bacterium]